MTVLEVLEKRNPEMISVWDKDNYKVIGPVSLDDEAVVMVKLENKGGMFQIATIPLSVKRIV